MLAALSLLAIPPLLRPVARSRTSAQTDSSSRVTVGMTLEPRIGRIAIVQAVDIRQQHQQRGADQVRDHRGQPVVVAERGLQFLDADGVVFVDDRHGAEFEQRQQRVADVEIAGAVVEIVGDQEHLGGMMAVQAEIAVVGFDQGALPDGGDGLKLGQIAGPAFDSEPTHAGADRPGADQRHLSARRDDLVQFFGQRGDALLIEQAVGAGEDAGADFHDERVSGGGDFLAEEIGHGRVIRVGNWR